MTDSLTRTQDYAVIDYYGRLASMALHLLTLLHRGITLSGRY